MGFPPQAVYKVADIADRLNASPARGRGRPRWDRWSTRKLLEAAGVELVQRGPRCALYVTHAALTKALGGDLINSMLDLEAHADRGLADEQLDQLDALEDAG